MTDPAFERNEQTVGADPSVQLDGVATLRAATVKAPAREELEAAARAMLDINVLVLAVREITLVVRDAEKKGAEDAWADAKPLLTGAMKSVMTAVEASERCGISADPELVKDLLSADLESNPDTAFTHLSALTLYLTSSARSLVSENLHRAGPIVRASGDTWEAAGMDLAATKAYITYLKNALRMMIDVESIGRDRNRVEAALKPANQEWSFMNYQLAPISVMTPLYQWARRSQIAVENFMKLDLADTGLEAPQIELPAEEKKSEAVDTGKEEPVVSTAKQSDTVTESIVSKAPELDPRLAALKSDTSAALLAALNVIEPISFTHAEECQEVLEKGADVLQIFAEIGLRSAPGAGATLEDLRSQRLALRELAENFGVLRGECEDAARKHFAAEGASVCVTLEPLALEVEKLLAAFDLEAQARCSEIIEARVTAAGAKPVMPLDPAAGAAPEEELRRLTATLEGEMKGASADLARPHVERCAATLEKSRSFAVRYEEFQKEIRSLESLSDRAAISALLSRVGEAVESFEREKLAFVEEVRSTFPGSPGADDLVAALQTLDRAGDEAYENFSQRAMVRLRGRSMPDSHATDPLTEAGVAEISAAAGKGFEAAISKLRKPVEERAEECFVKCSSALEKLENLAAMLVPLTDKPSPDGVALVCRANAAFGELESAVRDAGKAASALAEEDNGEPRKILAAALARIENQGAELRGDYRRSLDSAAWQSIIEDAPEAETGSVASEIQADLKIFNRNKSPGDPRRVELSERDGIVTLTRPNLASGQWTELEIEDNLLTLRAGSGAELQVRLNAGPAEARRYAGLFAVDTTPSSDTLAVAGSPIVRRLLADPEVSVVALRDAVVQNEDWREILPRFSGASLANVTLDKIDARGARARALDFNRVTLRGLDNLFGELEIKCEGRCNLNDAGNRWGTKLTVDLGDGSLAGNASRTELVLKGQALEYAEKAIEMKHAVISSMTRQKVVESELAVAAEYQKGFFGHVREKGILAGFRAWQSARETYRRVGKSPSYYEDLGREREQLAKQVPADRRFLSNLESVVRSSLGNLVFNAARGEHAFKMHSVRLSGADLRSVVAGSGTFDDLKEVLRSRLEHGALLREGANRSRITRNGFTVTVEKLLNSQGQDTGYAVLHFERPDGTRMPLDVGGQVRDLLKVRYETALRAAQNLIEARAGEEEKAVRALRFAKSRARRDLRRVSIEGDELTEE